MDAHPLQIILGLISALATGNCASLPELMVLTLYQPENCIIKSEVHNRLVVHYTGYFAGNKTFDSSRDRNTPFSFRLGMNEVTAPWDTGLIDMCVGEKRLVVIPEYLAVARPGYEQMVPAGNVLFYNIELLEIDKSMPSKEDFFKEIDSNFDKELSQGEMRVFLKKHLEIDIQKGIADGANEEDARAKMLLELDVILTKFFEQDDVNRDGVIDQNEYYRIYHNEF
ncbi:unnamed protein product [Allacma fusca]|uniref:peptidylprolyl isomerase n=1 Tax=Allacma fusca TaxID=39272 RepID=A0A8J2LFM3_9HEXA|nr:unnamed protein product [Allacma fusca]